MFSICHFFSNCFILPNPLPIPDSLRAVPQLKSFLHARIWFSNLFLIYDLEWYGLDYQFISLIWNFLLHLILFHYLISERFLYWIISSITLLYGKLCFLGFIPWTVFFFQAGFFVFWCLFLLLQWVFRVFMPFLFILPTLHMGRLPRLPICPDTISGHPILTGTNFSCAEAGFED